MKDKMLNKSITILNSIFIIIIIGFIISTSIEGKYWSLQSDYQNSISLNFGKNIYFLIMFGLINIINAFLIKDKPKLRFWYCVTGISFINLLLITITADDNITLLIVLMVIKVLAIEVLAIRNIVKMLKNKQKSKKLITYILCIIYGISHCITILWGALSCILFPFIDIFIGIILQYIYLFGTQEDEPIIKSKLIFTIISDLIIIIFTLYIAIISAIDAINYKMKIDESDKYKASIKQNLDRIVSDEETYESIYIPVCKDGKWGYINEKGEEIVECKYDEVTEFFTMRYTSEIESRNTNVSLLVKLSMVKEGNIYKLLHNSGEVIASCENNIIPWESDADDLYEGIDAIEQSSYFNDYGLDLESIYDDIYEDDEKIYLSNNVVLEVEENEESEDEYWKEDMQTYNLVAEKNGQIISQVENVCYLSDNRYSDGSIPFYNYEEKFVGWFDTDGNKYYVEGDFIILDVNNETIIIKDNLNNEISIYKNSIKTTEPENIEVTKNGYILTVRDGVLYRNKELELLGNFWTDIDDSYIDNDVLIGTTNNGAVLINTNGETISEMYDIIKGYKYYENDIMPRILSMYYFNPNIVKKTADILIEEYENIDLYY